MSGQQEAPLIDMGSITSGITNDSASHSHRCDVFLTGCVLIDDPVTLRARYLTFDTLPVPVIFT